MKHNKKRNTAFIFEVLIRELTKAVIQKDTNRKNSIVKLIRENFKSNNLLSKELELYKAMLDIENADRGMAEKIIFEARMQRKAINNRDLFEEQTVVIDQINKIISPDIFSNFVPNYKDLATISQIFNNRTKIKERVLLEKHILGKMMSLEEDNENSLAPIDNLTYKTFANKFNEKYSTELLPEQKELLKRYVTSFENDGVELKIFLNEEIPRLKEVLSEAFQTKEIKSDDDMIKNARKVYNILENSHKRDIDKILVQDILKIQHLAREITG